MQRFKTAYKLFVLYLFLIRGLAAAATSTRCRHLSVSERRICTNKSSLNVQRTADIMTWKRDAIRNAALSNFIQVDNNDCNFPSTRARVHRDGAFSNHKSLISHCNFRKTRPLIFSTTWSMALGNGRQA